MFRTFLQRRAAVIGLSAALVLGAVAGGGAALAVATGGSSPAVPSANTASLADSAAPTATSDQQCHPVVRIAARVLKDIAAKSGISAKTIAGDLKAGQTLDDILGSNAANVQQQVVTDIQARIQKAEQDGKLTQDQAQKLSDAAPAKIAKLFSTVHPLQKVRMRLDAIGAKYGVTRASLLQTAATTIGINADTLKSDIKSGQTIAQVAGDKTDAVVTALQQQVDAAIQQAATDGKLTSDQASALTTKANQRITNVVQNGFHKQGSGACN